MVICGGWGLLMFLEPISKCSGRFPYIFFITLHPVTFMSVDDSLFFNIGSLTFGATRKFLMVLLSFKIDLHSMFIACSLHAFIQCFVIWHHYVWILVDLLVVCITVVVLLLVSLGWCSHLALNPVECSCRVFTSF